ncbi:glycoside hydrolase family 48 protein [Hamadaea tsunoensis]|uniref:glycoside hydrolase family 48 protein n=1 Tax=Hamadaea tsunoensis TaxID=53368 RepID=UPI0003FCBFEF|nr:glycoside hydrolase family 48 protein [Hamadaea tsunoensis]
MSRSLVRRIGTRSRRLIAIGSALVLALAGIVAGAAPAHAAVACQVDYTTSDWTSTPTSGGFTANLTIHNLGDPITAWTLTFTFPNGQSGIQGWSANWSQSGAVVTATNLSWNGALATNATTGIGFNANWTGSNGKPTDFKINGQACTGANAAPTVSITSPASNTHFTAPAAFTIAATAADTAPGSVANVEFYRDGSLLGSDSSSPYSWAVSALPVGTYTFQAKAYDNQGATATAQITVIVDASTAPSIVTSAAAVSVPEGGSATVGVKLSAAPTANVSVTVARSAGDTDITVTPATLTFTTANWSTAQNITIAAAEDADNTNGTATVTLSATGYTSASISATESDNDQPVYVARFLEQYNKIKNSANGYFSPEGVPYHSIETLIVEAPDYGHETTSEAFSFWLWLEAQYGRASGNWAPFNQAWATMEKYIIPAHTDQPTSGASGTPQYAAEHDYPDQYPSPLEPSVPVGTDPLKSELTSTYGTSDIYGMHWLLDVDNKYGYGHCGDKTTRVAYINTFQRGAQESVWETVPQPACDTFTAGGQYGYLDLFIKDTGTPAKQWKYTDAPDADARAVEAAYWALQWSTAQNKQADVAATVAKAAKMGDYLRYALFDKYFKKIGNCVGASACAAGTGRDSEHYLLSWYYAWGGGMSDQWSWRIGSSFNHFGYQNPLAAYALSNVTDLKPKSASANADWTTSLQRQLEFYQWLQSSEGAIAGGATNSWGGNYGTPPTGTPTFYGMFYDQQPVYHDPPSNQWFGMQAWSLERLAEYYYVTGNATAKSILDKWTTWAMAHTTYTATTFSIPSDLSWSGAPNTWNASSPQANTNLHVTITANGSDAGIAASYARLLTYYAAKSGSTTAKATAKGLIDALYANSDSKGVGIPETRSDYSRFDDVYNATDHQGLYIPSTWTGTMPNGDKIKSGDSFLDIRSWYKQDPSWSSVQSYLNGGSAPSFTYHRFWAQSDIAMAYADFGYLFPNG